MSPDPSSILLQAQNHLMRQSSDLEVAQQLLQHSQGKREGAFATTNAASDPSLATDFVVQPSFHMDAEVEREIATEHGQNGGLSRSQEFNLAAQYASMNNSPPTGQVCR